MSYLDTHFKIPPTISKIIANVLSEYNGSEKMQGFGFAKNMITNGYVTGHQLKKLNYIFNNEPSEIIYTLHGGNKMKTWVAKKLSVTRGEIEKGKKDLPLRVNQTPIENS